MRKPLRCEIAGKPLAQAVLGDYRCCSMKEVSSKNFGILIAYLVPGFTALWGASYFSETIRLWIMGTSPDGPTIGGFLYVTLAAVAAGMTASTIRWAFIDTLHHVTGIPRPNWDFAQLESRINAFSLIVEHQFRYYEFYGNMIVSLVFLLVARRFEWGLWPIGWVDVGLAVLILVFYAGSRDTLTRYYQRGQMVVGVRADQPVATIDESSR